MKVYDMYLSEDKIPYLEEKKDFVHAQRITNPDEVFDLLNYVFRAKDLAEEHVWMIATNVKGEVLGVFEISHGTGSTAVVMPREVFMRALMVGASGIIVAHNHPSRDPSASREDIAVAMRLLEAGKLLDIPMNDFVIIGNWGYSFRENNTIEF